MLGEKAERRSAAPISSAIEWKRFLKTSSSMASRGIAVECTARTPGAEQSQASQQMPTQQQVPRFARDDNSRTTPGKPAVTANAIFLLTRTRTGPNICAVLRLTPTCWGECEPRAPKNLGERLGGTT